MYSFGQIYVSYRTLGPIELSRLIHRAIHREFIIEVSSPEVASRVPPRESSLFASRDKIARCRLYCR